MTVHHLANDQTPPSSRTLTAGEMALRAVDLAMARLHERGRLKPQQRSEKAKEYEEAAERCAASSDCRLSMLALAGHYAMAAQILRAGG